MELLEQHFETAFDAPSGIQKLRELILTLAMQGKLVKQDTSDESVSELLDKIDVETKQLVKEKKIKRLKSFPDIESDQAPHELPSQWRWVHLSQVSQLIEYGTSKKTCKDSSKVPVYRMGNIVDGQLIDANFKYIDQEVEDFPRLYLQENDILFNRTNSYELVGKTAIYKGENNVATFASYLIRVRLANDHLFPRYFSMAMNAPYFRKTQIEPEIVQQCGQANFNGTKLAATAIPLPPLPEQRRIVAKIDQLMARCDELEKLRTERNQKRLTVHTAALNRLLTAQSSDAFTEAWQFMAQHFSELYSVKENVAELRKAILQLAVMGKLVEQDPSDEPASELLKKIEIEKQQLLKDGQIKRTKSFSEIKSEDLPYQLPTGWEWIRLGNAGAFERGRSKHRPRNDKRLFYDGIYPFVQTGDVSRAKTTNDVITTCGKYYNDFGLQQSRLWPKDTLCITIAANIAETGFLGMEACIPDSVVAFLSLHDSIAKFVKFFIDVAKEDLENYAPSTAQKNINLGIINELLFPLPPLKEQHRIVAKVDQLMALCDTLEQRIDSAKNKQTALLNAVMISV